MTPKKLKQLIIETMDEVNMVNDPNLFLPVPQMDTMSESFFVRPYVKLKVSSTFTFFLLFNMKK